MSMSAKKLRLVPLSDMQAVQVRLYLLGGYQGRPRSLRGAACADLR